MIKHVMWQFNHNYLEPCLRVKKFSSMISHYLACE